MQIVIDTKRCPFRTLGNQCELLLEATCLEDDIYNVCPLKVYGTTVKHGHWINHKADPCGGRGCDTKECSSCNAEQRYLLDDNYCPSCGAIMDEEEEDERLYK